MVSFRVRSVFFVGALVGAAVVQLVPVHSGDAAVQGRSAILLDGGSRGWVTLDVIDAMALPFSREILDPDNMHFEEFPTCVVVPKSAGYRIVAAVIFQLEESGQREVYVTATSPDGEIIRISELLRVFPHQTEQTRLAIFVNVRINAGDCVELRAGAPSVAGNGIGAIVAGFALWER